MNFGINCVLTFRKLTSSSISSQDFVYGYKVQTAFRTQLIQVTAETYSTGDYISAVISYRYRKWKWKQTITAILLWILPKSCVGNDNDYYNVMLLPKNTQECNKQAYLSQYQLMYNKNKTK